ncbi:MAG: TonB-dependent receptor plug domain-containing protein [Burkholderiales bacterium]
MKWFLDEKSKRNRFMEDHEMNEAALGSNRKTAGRRQPVIALGPMVVAVCLALHAGGVAAQTAPGSTSAVDLSRMTLEQLTNIEISSVSKHTERLIDAAASIYVITNEDIRRSGATSIPEILRLAPNLQVARVDSSQYAISARGFNSTTANKLLVLIDGRSVYTPLFSGVFWDAQDTMIEDIERIEVISGPGGTLWGANAVNGVINIITRHTRDTTGGLVSAGVGNDERGAGARYGGKLGEDATYRIYAKVFNRDNTVTASGASAQDASKKGQVGFRLDWSKGGDTLALQGDAYDGSIDQKIFDDKSISGAHLLGRWNRTLAGGSAVQVQAYYDQTRRNYPGTFGEALDTYDIDVQHRFSPGGRHDITWGGGYRYSRDSVTNNAVLAFLPANRDLTLGNVFVQDDIALSERLKLTVGTKLEHNNYTGFENQPNVRLAWKPDDSVLLWSAISRAVRTPSRIDRDFFVPGSSPYTVLGGGPDFQSEKLTAYEIGYRAQPSAKASFSISTFYNVYDELRSLEPAGGTPVFANMMEGNTYGVETWGSYGISEWWQLKAGYTYLRKDLRFKPGSGDTSGVQAAGNDPSHQFSVRSMMNLGHNVDFDVALRSVDSLPNPAVPSYVALDGRLGWKISKGTEVSLSGFNLLDKRHPEFGAAPARSEIGRAFYVKMLWNF